MFKLEDFAAFFTLLDQRFQQEEDALNRLDAAIGDGDHGSTIARAFNGAAQVSRRAYTDFGAAFEAVSEAVAEQAGGAIGPLLAAFFADMGTQLTEQAELSAAQLAGAMSAGVEALQQVGGAQLGQKTLLDALIPAVRALEENKHLPLAEALAQAAQAAAQGADNTRNLAAMQGRAHFLGERSIGYKDPGAVSIALFFATFSAFMHGERAAALPSAHDHKKEARPPSGKLINAAGDLVQEDLEGLAAAFPQYIRLTADNLLVRAQPKAAGNVGLAIGHGGGHTPSMGGLVGCGLLDADVYGPLFTCASGIRISQAIEAAEHGAGVALLVSNHSGDVLNAKLALRRARQAGIEVEPVYLGDDIATAPRERLAERRGLGGLLFALKVGGAAAEAGKPLAEVVRLMRACNERTATLAVTVRAPTHPASGEPLFSLPAGEIEIGTGVHGEIGVYRGSQMAADEIVDLLMEKLLADLAGFQSSRMLAFVNGSGGTSRAELHILYRRVKQVLAKAHIRTGIRRGGITIHHLRNGRFFIIVVGVG